LVTLSNNWTNNRRSHSFFC